MYYPTGTDEVPALVTQNAAQVQNTDAPADNSNSSTEEDCKCQISPISPFL